MNDRVLQFDGCSNVRDLGGLRIGDARTTLYKAVIRSDTPARLSQAGWSALYDYGIRTIITLHTHGMVEPELDFTSPYPDIAVVQAEIEDVTDKEYVQKFVETSLWGSPLYFKDALQRWPRRHAAVVSAVGRAQPGGVLFHCIRGHDRTGIISLLLLALAGVTVDDITADYEMSLDPVRDQVLAREHTTSRDAIHKTLKGFDLDAYLLAAGATPDDLASVRKRLAG